MSSQNQIRKYVRQILAEINDYSKYDIDDYDETYNGSVYFYSEHPVTLEEVKKEPNLQVLLFNRADASDTTSEYVYQIKTKKPLYKKYDSLKHWMSLDHDEFDSKKIDVSQFSGYFKYSTMTQENIAYIDTKDIISFRLVGGFVKYDKEKIDPRHINISDEADNFLYSYISGQINHKKLTPEIQAELEQFKPNGPVKIYKGIEEVQIRHYSEQQPPYKLGQFVTTTFPHITSWTRNPLIGRRFIDDYPSSVPFLVEMVVKPEDMVVDVQMLPNKYYHTNQREIMLKPGTYSYKIVWMGK